MVTPSFRLSDPGIYRSPENTLCRLIGPFSEQHVYDTNIYQLTFHNRVCGIGVWAGDRSWNFAPIDGVPIDLCLVWMGAWLLKDDNGEDDTNLILRFGLERKLGKYRWLAVSRYHTSVRQNETLQDMYAYREIRSACSISYPDADIHGVIRSWNFSSRISKFRLGKP